MNAIIEETGAIDLATDRTDFVCPDDMLRLASDHTCKEYTGYIPVEGLLGLREAIAGRIKERYMHAYNPQTEITVTAGPVQAIHTAISAIVSDEDEVILFEPACETFIPSILLNNGKPVYVQLKSPGFRIDWEELRKMVTSKTRMIILESPQNPTGSVLSEEDLMQLQRLTAGTKIVLLSVETGGPVVFDNIVYQSVSRFDKLADRSLVVSSFEHLYHHANWGVSFCMAPEKLMAEFRKVHRFHIRQVNVPFQSALAEYLQISFPLEDIIELYQGKRNYFNRLMGKSLFRVIPAQGGVYELLDYSGVSDMPDIAFAQHIARGYGVAVIPGSAYYHEKSKDRYLRVCFSRNNNTLDQAAERLLQVTAPVAK